MTVAQSYLISLLVCTLGVALALPGCGPPLRLTFSSQTVRFESYVWPSMCYPDILVEDFGSHSAG